MIKRIAFVNGKGGCSKTTSIINITGVLAARGEKILVIDLDKQGNCSSSLLRETDKPEKTVYDLFTGNGLEVQKALFKSHGNAKPKYYGVDVITADPRLSDESALQDVDGETVGSLLRDYEEDNGYDWVLVDMPPSNKILNDICFKYLVDYVLIPFSSDVFSVDGYGDIIDTLDEARTKNPSLNILGVFLGRYMSNCSLDRYIRQQLLQFDTFIDIQIPLAADIREAVFFGRPISFYKKNSKSTRAYEELVENIEEKIRRNFS